MPKRTFFRLDEDKRERVIRSAINEFRKNGYENSKVGAVAKGAGIANGSIYQYFDDKLELFLYCVNWTVENFIRDQDRQMPLAGMDLFEYLQSGLPDRAAYWAQEPDLAIFAHDLLNGSVEFPPGERNAVKDTSGAHIPKLISNGQKWGSLRDDADESILALVVTGVVREAEEMVYRDAAASGFVLPEDRSADLRRRLNGLTELLKRGLEKKAD